MSEEEFMEPSSAPPGRLLVAVVHAADGVRFATAADSRAALMERLADYVRTRGELVLWPNDARIVRMLIDAGYFEIAVEWYFRCVGRRWDEEHLVTASVTTNESHVEHVRRLPSDDNRRRRDIALR